MTTLITLQCGHEGRFSPPPRFRDQVYCTRCGDYTTVAPVSQWQIRCEACTLARRFGADEHEARRTGRRHLIRYPTHTVILGHGPDTERMSADDTALPDYVQWHRDNPEHASALRNLVAETNTVGVRCDPDSRDQVVTLP